MRFALSLGSRYATVGRLEGLGRGHKEPWIGSGGVVTVAFVTVVSTCCVSDVRGHKTSLWRLDNLRWLSVLWLDGRFRWPPASDNAASPGRGSAVAYTITTHIAEGKRPREPLRCCGWSACLGAPIPVRAHVQTYGPVCLHWFSMGRGGGIGGWRLAHRTRPCCSSPISLCSKKFIFANNSARKT